MVEGSGTRTYQSLLRVFLFFCTLGCIIILAGNAYSLPVVSEQTGESTADHSKFEELQHDFESGPEVTQACLSCHTEAASQIQHTFHWTWAPDKSDDSCLGKARYLNNL